MLHANRAGFIQKTFKRQGFRRRAQTVYRPRAARKRDAPVFHWEHHMLGRGSICAVALTAVLCLPMHGVRAQEEVKFPDLSGQWKRPPGVGIQWDQTKPIGRAQQPPLTPEYQAIFEASLNDQAQGGQGNDPRFTCIPNGMPRIMSVIFPMEIVPLPKITYMMFEYDIPRRIYTDGRDWPRNAEPTFMGYSIGKWVADGSGHGAALEVETRNMKGPRTYDTSGLPLHKDNQTVVKERIYLDRADDDLLHDEITTIDDALTRPWTVDKRYRRERNVVWVENVCNEYNSHVAIHNEIYYLSADGDLMPAKKDQQPPSLKYFKPSQKP
jgi:hypothetical protein